MVTDKTIVTCLYIDASNLYGAISDLLPNGSYIDFGDILRCLEEDFHIHQIKAYGTYLPDEPNSPPTRQKFIGAQSKFFRSIKAIPRVEFFKGYFSATSNKEKGIDVKLAVDMLKDAYEGSYKCALIMTGDDDFLYSIECVRKINIPVHLTAFASRFPYGIAHNTNHRYVYDLNGYFTNTILPNLKQAPRNIQIKDITNKVAIISV
ncbi:MAG TPA: NYN domain-containing protein [Bacillota bacterium]|nr:NYN domain-containing protein [Bacillota bacterium]